MAKIGKKNIFVTQRLPEKAMKKLLSVFNVDLWRKEIAPSKRTIGEKIKRADGLCCTLNDQIDKEVIESAGEQFKIIAQVAVGYDNIDLVAATRKGIFVTNTPGVLTETTADFAFGLIFAVARRMIEADKYVRNGDWIIPWGLDMMLGQDIWGKTLGIIGLGRIGAAVARRAKGMNMKILYYDSNRNVDLERNLGTR
jgi:glyoxylate reductase